MNVTSDLPCAGGDERVVADALFGTLDAELHRLARRELDRRGPAGGLGATTLRHEARRQLEALPGAGGAEMKVALARLIELYVAWRKPEQAATFRTLLGS